MSENGPQPIKDNSPKGNLNAFQNTAQILKLDNASQLARSTTKPNDITNLKQDFDTKTILDLIPQNKKSEITGGILNLAKIASSIFGGIKK